MCLARDKPESDFGHADHEYTLKLRTGEEAQLKVFSYPIGPQLQQRILSLYRIEWDSGDYDWHRAMNGEYANTLTISTAMAEVQGQDAATASVLYSVKEPEVAAISCVLTHPEFRGRGLAAGVTDVVARLAFQKECQAVYLGATRMPGCVYLKAGFVWYNGGVMRRLAEKAESFEADYFKVRQSTTVRNAQWGDLAAVACLLVRPYRWVAADYSRGLFSGKYIQQQRCTSNFSYIYDDLIAKNGTCKVLIGAKAHRVLGLASLTPGPTEIQKHAAVLDFLVHENYTTAASELVAETLQSGCQGVICEITSYVVDRDSEKIDILRSHGFSPVASIPGQLQLGDESANLRVLHRSLR